jgi:hypothetical protein
MKGKNEQDGPRVAPAMVEDKATERLKKRMQDLGLIVNAGVGKATGQAGKKKGDTRKTEERQ